MWNADSGNSPARAPRRCLPWLYAGGAAGLISTKLSYQGIPNDRHLRRLHHVFDFFVGCGVARWTWADDCHGRLHPCRCIYIDCRALWRTVLGQISGRSANDGLDIHAVSKHHRPQAIRRLTSGEIDVALLPGRKAQTKVIENHRPCLCLSLP
jgi:hypothetical protein